MWKVSRLGCSFIVSSLLQQVSYLFCSHASSLDHVDNFRHQYLHNGASRTFNASTYNPNLFLMDAIHLSCTIVDVLNLSEERLTPSNKEQNRGAWWDNSSKLVALGLLSWMFFQAQWESGKLGFYAYLCIGYWRILFLSK
jgi:hypothetical protein